MPVQFDPKTIDFSNTIPGLELSQLFLIHRHGERTPISTHKFPFSPESYNICTLLVPSASRIQVPTTINPVADTTPQTSSIECYPGQLTDPGKQNMQSLGQNILSHYPFISSINPLDIFVRSTGYNRTVESVTWLINGLGFTTRNEKRQGGEVIHDTMNDPKNVFTDSNSSSTGKEVVVEIHPLGSETMLQGSKCTKLESLIREWKGLKVKIDTHDGIASGHSAYDAAVCARDNLGTHVEGIDLLEKRCVERWWDMYHDRALSRLAMGRFVGEVFDKVESGTRFGIFSGVFDARHDSTIGPVLGAFGCFDGRFPPFGSVIGLEVWKSANEKYVRMHYNGKKMLIPVCGEVGNHFKGDKSMCTYSAFQKCVEEIVPMDYEGECRQPHVEL